MAYTKLIPRYTPGARAEEISSNDGHKTYRLAIPAGPATQYRFAQLDDYTQNKRGKFPLRFPPSSSLRASLTLNLAARASSDSISGTWGFGLWNDPFGLSLGFGGNPFRLPALPNAAWFFGASKENYLSFRDPSTSLRSAQGGVANGFIAQTFRSPKFHPLLIPAGLALPFSRQTTRQLLGKVIDEDGIDLRKVGQPVNPTQWHQYKLVWQEKRVFFEVDDIRVFETSVSPKPPLGLVIWIDNQYAAFTPEGKIGFGVLENPEPAWLEIQDIEINTYDQ